MHLNCAKAQADSNSMNTTIKLGDAYASSLVTVAAIGVPCMRD